MSVQDVAAAARTANEAAAALRAACADADHAGVPQAAIARAAGVARNTVRAWINAEAWQDTASQVSDVTLDESHSFARDNAEATTEAQRVSRG